MLQGAQAWEIRLQDFYTNQVGDLETWQKIENFDGLGLKTAVLYFKAQSLTSVKNLKRCRWQQFKKLFFKPYKKHFWTK